MARDFEVTINPKFNIIKKNLNNFNQESLDRIHFRLVQGANEIRNVIINSMRRTPKTGNKYKRGKRWHIASSPGHAPAVDTGQLLRSIVMDERIDEIEIGVKSGAPYAAALEKGTRTAGRSKNVIILPRPFLKPAADKRVPVIKRRIAWDIERIKF